MKGRLQDVLSPAYVWPSMRKSICWGYNDADFPETLFVQYIRTINLQLSRYAPNQQVLHLRFKKTKKPKKYVERAAHINHSVCTRVSLLLVFETWRLEFTSLFNKYRSVVLWSGDSRSCYLYQVRRLVCSIATAKQKRSSIYCGPSASHLRCVHEQHRFYTKDLYWYISRAGEIIIARLRYSPHTCYIRTTGRQLRRWTTRLGRTSDGLRTTWTGSMTRHKDRTRRRCWTIRISQMT